MQGQIFLKSQRELQTRFIDVAEGRILFLNFTSDRFTNGEIRIVVKSSWWTHRLFHFISGLLVGLFGAELRQ